MRMLFWLRHWVMRSVQIRSAEFFAPPTAAKHGRKFYRKTKTLAGSTSFSIRTIRTSCSHRFGRRGGNRGFSPAAARAADFTLWEITAWHGKGSGGNGFPAGSLARSAAAVLEVVPIPVFRSF